MSQRALWFLAWTALLAGTGLSALGMVELQQQMELSASGVRSPGKVIDFVLPKWRYTGVSADVDLLSLQAQPLRIHIEHASSLRDWAKGTMLDIVCKTGIDRPEACKVDAFADRWLDPALALIAGVPAFIWGGVALRMIRAGVKGSR